MKTGKEFILHHSTMLSDILSIDDRYTSIKCVAYQRSDKHSEDKWIKAVIAKLKASKSISSLTFTHHKLLVDLAPAIISNASINSIKVELSATSTKRHPVWYLEDNATKSIIGILNKEHIKSISLVGIPFKEKYQESIIKALKKSSANSIEIDYIHFSQPMMKKLIGVIKENVNIKHVSINIEDIVSNYPELLSDLLDAVKDKSFNFKLSKLTESELVKLSQSKFWEQPKLGEFIQYKIDEITKIELTKDNINNIINKFISLPSDEQFLLLKNEKINKSFKHLKSEITSYYTQLAIKNLERHLGGECEEKFKASWSFINLKYVDFDYVAEHVAGKISFGWEDGIGIINKLVEIGVLREEEKITIPESIRGEEGKSLEEKINRGGEAYKKYLETYITNAHNQDKKLESSLSPFSKQLSKLASVRDDIEASLPKLDIAKLIDVYREQYKVQNDDCIYILYKKFAPEKMPASLVLTEKRKDRIELIYSEIKAEQKQEKSASSLIINRETIKKEFAELFECIPPAAVKAESLAIVPKLDDKFDTDKFLGLIAKICAKSKNPAEENLEQIKMILKKLNDLGQQDLAIFSAFHLGCFADKRFEESRCFGEMIPRDAGGRPSNISSDLLENYQVITVNIKPSDESKSIKEHLTEINSMVNNLEKEIAKSGGAGRSA